MAALRSVPPVTAHTISDALEASSEKAAVWRLGKLIIDHNHEVRKRAGRGADRIGQGNPRWPTRPAGATPSFPPFSRLAVGRRAVVVMPVAQCPQPWRSDRRGGGLHDTDRRRLADRVRASEAFRALCGLWLDLNFSHCGWGTLHPSIVGVAAFLGEPPMRPNSKVILPYEPGYTGHWEMKKRRKETKESLRQREQEVRDRLNSPSIVPGHGMSGTTKP